jgi:hypothetical protein
MRISAIRITTDPAITQKFLLLFSMCFRLEGRHQVEHKSKGICVCMCVYVCVCVYKHFVWNLSLKTSQFVLLCGYTQHGKNNLVIRNCIFEGTSVSNG